MSLNAQSPLAFQWAHSVDGATTGGDNVMGMCKSSDGYYYIATNFGTSTTQKALNVWFDGELLKMSMVLTRAVHTQVQVRMAICCYKSS